MPTIPIVIEQGQENYGASVPDLPGCFSTGRTLDDLRANIREAILLYLEDLKEVGEPLPVSYSLVEYIDLSS